MSHFDRAMQTVLHHEGGYVDDPHDAGGATKYGISLRWLKTVDKNADKSIIKNLTLGTAVKLYKTHWWDRYDYDRINNEQVATKIFDLAVNMGATQAHKLAQRAVRAATGRVLVEDGILGSKSIAAINSANPDILLAALRSEAACYYRSLNQPRFLNGWLNRAYS